MAVAPWLDATRSSSGGDGSGGYGTWPCWDCGARLDRANAAGAGRHSRGGVLAIALGIDVAATDHGHHRSVETRDTRLARPERERRHGQRARRLGDQPALLGREPDARRDLRLGDRDDVVEVRPQVLERPSPERLAARPVRDGPRNEVRLPADDLAAPQRFLRVGRQLRFDADHPDIRPQRLDRRRDAARQPAAADGQEDGREVGQVLDQLEADRALSRDDPVVVVGRDDGQPPVRGDRLGHPLALIAARPDDDHLGAVRFDPLALDPGCVGRHDHDGRDAEQRRGAGDALGVVARGVGDDAAGPLVGVSDAIVA